ncbi:MAG: response regulator [Sulfuricella sp.]|nr:response regulator [Sulfuricella sp.]
MYRILLVDDETYVLSALRRELLRPPEVGIDGLLIEAFSSPDAALQRVTQSGGYFDAAIADYRMPGIDGVAFLETLAAFQPDAGRIILSGHADMTELIGAINRAHIDAFIAKPWLEYDLKGILLQVLKHGELRRENRRLAGLLVENGRNRQPERVAAYRMMAIGGDVAQLKALRQALKRPLATKDGAHAKVQVEIFASPEKALAAANRQRMLDAVIADYDLPGSDGVTLLGELRRRHPAAVRILLSDKLDVDMLVRAVNVAGVYHHLLKPWFDMELRALVGRALAYREMELENRILANLARLKERN